RFGLEAVYVDPASGTHLPLKEHILATLDRVQPYAISPGTGAALELLRSSTERGHNDARWLRDAQTREQLLGEVTRQAGLQFRKSETHVA
ncbi:MAG: glutamate--cysteine ligase, partial [Burkholderiaceae bacterium]|nr:glutamate--cysteine ligase [Burkholderiaceae bacterium]